MKQFLESQDFLKTITTLSQQNDADARQLASGLTQDQLNWKPAPDRWSIAQCLDHLAVTSGQFDPYFTKAIRQGHAAKAIGDPLPYQPSFMGRWLIKQLLPEATRKVPAPKVFRPSESSSIDGALEKFLAQQKAFLSFVKDARGIDYNKVRLRSPVTPLMRYSLADAFVVTVVHGQRHLQQARRVLEEFRGRTPNSR